MYQKLKATSPDHSLIKEYGLKLSCIYVVVIFSCRHVQHDSDTLYAGHLLAISSIPCCFWINYETISIWRELLCSCEQKVFKLAQKKGTRSKKVGKNRNHGKPTEWLPIFKCKSYALSACAVLCGLNCATKRCYGLLCLAAVVISFLVHKLFHDNLNTFFSCTFISSTTL
jgi:hypothetical protein